MSSGPLDPIPPKPAYTEPLTQPKGKHEKVAPGPYGKSTSAPMSFLGMHFTAKEAKALWTAIMQQVSSQIRREQARALKAIRKLRKSETDQ